MPQQPVSGADGLDAGGFQQRDVGRGAAERFLVAVAVQQRAAADARCGFQLARLQEFGERHGLLRELRRAGVAGEELEQLVLEDRVAAGLEDDDGHARFDLRRERGEDFLAATPSPGRACRSRSTAGRSTVARFGSSTRAPEASSTRAAASALCGRK